MSLYAFKTKDDPAVLCWVKATKERAKDDTFIKNPFKWRIKTLKRKNSLFVVVESNPVYFNFSWFGWITGLLVLIVWGSHWVLIPCCAVGMLGLFWTAEPIFLLTKKALRKHGYSGPIERLKFSDLIKEVVL